MRWLNVGSLALGLLGCHRPAPGPAVNESKGSMQPAAASAEPRAMSPPASADRRAVPPPKMDPRRETAFLKRVCVTEGEFAEHLVVKASKMRCVDAESPGDGAKLRFRYDGATAERSALKSGAIREQIGLKLRARDTCNLVYVMWRLKPTPSVVVSFKDNPGESAHAGCENRGYTNIRPSAQAPPPPATPGREYELSAQIDADRLRAWVDGQLVWEGILPPGAAALVGPAGVRSDNVAWSLLDFDAGGTEGANERATSLPAICRNRR